MYIIFQYNSYSSYPIGSMGLVYVQLQFWYIYQPLIFNCDVMLVFSFVRRSWLRKTSNRLPDSSTMFYSPTHPPWLLKPTILAPQTNQPTNQPTNQAPRPQPTPANRAFVYIYIQGLEIGFDFRIVKNIPEPRKKL